MSIISKYINILFTQNSFFIFHVLVWKIVLIYNIIIWYFNEKISHVCKIHSMHIYSLLTN